MEGLADRRGVAEEAGNAASEVGVVGDGPKVRAVAVDNDGFALTHSPDDGVGILAAVDGYQRVEVCIGERGTDDDAREAFLDVFSKGHLGSHFVPRVGAVDVAEGHVFRDQIFLQRLSVDRAGGDQDVLVGAAVKEADGLLLLKRLHAPVADTVQKGRRLSLQNQHPGDVLYPSLHLDGPGDRVVSKELLPAEIHGKLKGETGSGDVDDVPQIQSHSILLTWYGGYFSKLPTDCQG